MKSNPYFQFLRATAYVELYRVTEVTAISESLDYVFIQTERYTKKC